MKKIAAPNSPASSNAPTPRAHKKNASLPLSIQEETDDVIFSRDAQELLRRPSFSDTLDKAQHSNRGWLKKLASNGRRWNKRYFVVHGHYLSYFKSENTADKKNLMGAVNLWRVESVTLDKSIIVIALAPDVAVNTNSIMSSFGLIKKDAMNRILLDASDPQQANRWLTTMKVAPFEEPSPKALADQTKDENDNDGEELDDGRSQASAKTQIEDKFNVKAIHVTIGEGRSYDFVDISELSEMTRLRIGELDPARLSALVVVDIDSRGEERKASVMFQPGDGQGGILRIPFSEGGEAQIVWEVDDELSVEELIRQAMAEDSPSTLLLPVAGGLFVVTLFIIYVVLEFRFLTSAVVAAMLSGSALAMLYVPQQSVASPGSTGKRYVFTTISFVSVRRLTSAASTVTSLAIEQAMAKKKDSAIGDDVSILENEKPKIAELRRRLADVRSINFIDVAMRDGKWDKIQTEWKVREAERPLSEVQEKVTKKYLDHDFRLVRFLRARNLNVDKAEKLARTSLLWRMCTLPDFYVDDYTPPSWIVDYGGAPLFVQSLKDFDHGMETRIKSWWLRDKQGGLAMFFRTGTFDWRKVNRKMGDAVALMKVGFWALEMGRRDMDTLHHRSNGTAPSYLTAVVDLEGFSLTQQIPLTELIPLARRFFGVLATSYPELLKRVIVINTPFLFNGLWQAIRPFIPEEVQDKIQIHGRCDLNRHLLPYFTEDQIPAYLGGKITGENGDAFCKNRLPPAGPYLADAGAELLKTK